MSFDRSFLVDKTYTKLFYRPVVSSCEDSLGVDCVSNKAKQLKLGLFPSTDGEDEVNIVWNHSRFSCNIKSQVDH